MTLGKGSIIDFYKKQKVNTDSSTTAELVGVSNVMHHMERTDMFIQAQGCMCTTRLHQDNEMPQWLKINGKRSLSQST